MWKKHVTSLYRCFLHISLGLSQCLYLTPGEKWKVWQSETCVKKLPQGCTWENDLQRQSVTLLSFSSFYYLHSNATPCSSEVILCIVETFCPWQFRGKSRDHILPRPSQITQFIISVKTITIFCSQKSHISLSFHWE